MTLPISAGTVGVFAGLGMNGLPGIPILQVPNGPKIERPNLEWALHHLRWRWLLDSWEGGEAYRTAIYGFDLQGMPVRNLVRHKHEYPGPGESYGAQGRPFGTDQAAQATATDDDYELRRARTPIPGFVSEAIKTHLSRIYCHEVRREGADLEAFWADPTGQRQGDMKAWFPSAVAPLLMALGQLDFLVDRPAAPADDQPKSRADDYRLKLDRAIVQLVLPTDVVWWRLDALGRYTDVLIRETDDDGNPAWRYWGPTHWHLFNADGKHVGGKEHTYGRPPIVRVFDGRRPRCKHVGMPRYETIAELQREFYNRDSELILSDTIQAHPLIQGPEDFFEVGEDGQASMPMGPSFMLPKRKINGGSGGYEGFDVVEFPKDGAASLRANKLDMRDAVDRAALLTKPAGAAGTNGSTVSQSGTSKRLDQSAGNDLLTQIAEVLAAAEGRLAELAVLVQSGGSIDPSTSAEKPSWKVVYPQRFDLATAEELANQVADFQAILAAAGKVPEIEFACLSALVRLMRPGLEPDDYKAFDVELEAYLDEAEKRQEAQREAEARYPAPLGTDPNKPGEAPGAPAPNLEPATRSDLQEVY
ncbi:hypothetical protein [Paludisphaera rhizosphaerae]|uniref:hypothetical protein n=1 Tax=Paludisphaera rhizosphaerae TaxID=2711216 RepID=UPI0013ED810C|nr:hypothetical protein [Paludisphaera rhizosphaerae]